MVYLQCVWLMFKLPIYFSIWKPYILPQFTILSNLQHCSPTYLVLPLVYQTNNILKVKWRKTAGYYPLLLFINSPHISKGLPQLRDWIWFVHYFAGLNAFNRILIHPSDVIEEILISHVKFESTPVFSREQIKLVLWPGNYLNNRLGRFFQRTLIKLSE